MCRGAHSVRTEVSGMPLGKAKFVAHPPYGQEAVKLELCVLRNHMATMINPKLRCVRRYCWWMTISSNWTCSPSP